MTKSQGLVPKTILGGAGVVAGETVRLFLNVKDKASHQAGASAGVSHPLVSDCSFSLSEPGAV